MSIFRRLLDGELFEAYPQKGAEQVQLYLLGFRRHNKISMEEFKAGFVNDQSGKPFGNVKIIPRASPKPKKLSTKEKIEIRNAANTCPRCGKINHGALHVCQCGRVTMAGRKVR